MTRYTVTTPAAVENELARLWINARDRAAVSRAADKLDRELCVDAGQKGRPAYSGLRQLAIGPLIAEFSVNENDRIVTIWSIRHKGTITNGH
jgi:hypothetical protein